MIFWYLRNTWSKISPKEGGGGGVELFSNITPTLTLLRAGPWTSAPSVLDDYSEHTIPHAFLSCFSSTGRRMRSNVGQHCPTFGRSWGEQFVSMFGSPVQGSARRRGLLEHFPSSSPPPPPSMGIRLERITGLQVLGVTHKRPVTTWVLRQSCPQSDGVSMQGLLRHSSRSDVTLHIRHRRLRRKP